MNVKRVSKTIPAKRYSNFPNIMNFYKHHGPKRCAFLSDLLNGLRLTFYLFLINGSRIKRVFTDINVAIL